MTPAGTTTAIASEGEADIDTSVITNFNALEFVTNAANGFHYYF